MKNPRYMFTDAQGMASQYPETFDADEIAWLREHVQPGVFAKVCIQQRTDPSRGTERPWTQVVSVDDCKVKATLANDPFFLPGKFGDKVEFELRHIYSVLTEDEMNAQAEARHGNEKGK